MEYTEKEICDMILIAFGKKHTDIAKKRHGSVKEYTCGEVVDRLLKYKGRISVEEVFPEVKTRVTINKILVGAFGTKSTREKTWLCYILEKVNLKYCNKCARVVSTDKFYVVKNNKLRTICIDCDLNTSKVYRDNNSDRVKDRSKLYYTEHKAEAAARSIMRKYRERIAIPKWANLEVIKEFYKNRPEGYHVDHIIPLKGKLVCGLHVENNLQYLLAVDNISKGNKYTP